jgi:hypothetical protein
MKNQLRHHAPLPGSQFATVAIEVADEYFICGSTELSFTSVDAAPEPYEFAANERCRQSGTHTAIAVPRPARPMYSRSWISGDLVQGTQKEMTL